MIAELNEILENEVVDENGLWKKKITEQSLKVFDRLPEAIQEQLIATLDQNRNVQVIDHGQLCLLVRQID
ncbi:pyrophosphate--fructose 6-phosphate 1-phosphotransferase subunit beta 1 [Arabidopsis lyrata subsp. lyrata]|uniref:pyrophosphate--fructose 6-phosphate 1-phosphotransferase subunit beta 1 n=1 Tax=Arabidopsis lyrata subsp. lyrata TaxID=81972 RepID=UPI000A29E72F|nr:pyrophosphate--fructose 6-phosphate 1-phosphotransferase subunit beta 1 [Arabidopsis lyrata subsp. lyrata]|eukprot:XP_020886588.1 pyrophosphate--fructose 6-phosphate 1-phosphotransferase subunit beta 1 [Arabidopsis lyrata subsp. lyrata]